MMRILKHELSTMLREPRFWIPFLIPPLFLVGMQAFMLSQKELMTTEIDLGMLLVTGALLSTMSVTLTADSFAGERERNTLELLLCLPIRMRDLFWGKLLAVLPIPVVLAMSSQALLWNLMPGTPGMALVQAWIYSLSLCLVVTSIALYVSLVSPSVRSAAQINVLFVLVLLFGTHAMGAKYFHQIYFAPLILLAAVGIFTMLTFLATRRFREL